MATGGTMRPANYPGEKPEREDPTATVTFESALRDAGVTEGLLAKKLKAQLEAKKPRWNPKKKSWEEPDDYETQLAAAREIIKIFGGYSSESENDGEGGYIFINGDQTTISSSGPPSHFQRRSKASVIATEAGERLAVTCESALREEGVNEALVAKKLRAHLEAKHWRWNPKKKVFEEFDDYDAQLAAGTEIIKLFGATERNGRFVVIDITDSFMSRPRRSGICSDS
jgi:hypothetical protein